MKLTRYLFKSETLQVLSNYCTLVAINFLFIALPLTECRFNIFFLSCRCMFVKIVVTPPRNLNYTTFTWKKNIPTVRLYWNSMTKDILSSTIPALPACCSKSIRSRFKKTLKNKTYFRFGIFCFPSPDLSLILLKLLKIIRLILNIKIIMKTH